MTDDDSCAICLQAMTEEQRREYAVTRIQACKHEFHFTCVAGWILRGQNTCPACRASILEKPSQAETTRVSWWVGWRPWIPLTLVTFLYVLATEGTAISSSELLRRPTRMLVGAEECIMSELIWGVEVRDFARLVAHFLYTLVQRHCVMSAYEGLLFFLFLFKLIRLPLLFVGYLLGLL